MLKWIVFALLIAAPVSGAAAHNLTVDDLFNERDVAEPQLSPDGNWIVYSVAQMDAKADETFTHLWMTSFDGKRTLQLTGRARESETAPRFSPDGRTIAFLSDRSDGKDKDDAVVQVWLMDRAGGEARRLTDFKGGVSDLAWSPDGKKLALIVEDEKKQGKDEKKDEDAGEKKPKPIVIDRYYFKEDVTGYLGKQRQHLFVVDVASGKAQRIVPGEYDEYLPAWSPDGKSIAFVSKRARKDFDRDDNWDLYLVAAKPNSQPRPLTAFPGPDNAPGWGTLNAPSASNYPVWSPDGTWIAYIQGGPLKLIEYAVQHLAIVPASGGAPRILTASLDRNVMSPVWSADGKTIRFLVEDDRTEWLGQVPAAGGAVTKLLSQRNGIFAASDLRKGRQALLISSPTAPQEIFAFDGSGLRQVTHQNTWLKDVALSQPMETSFRNRDGTEVHGYVVPPAGYRKGQRYPALLRIHGGPVYQWDLSFYFDLQFYAGRGYAVIVANPRGSSGRGEAYAKAIYANWGDKDAKDDLAAVDDAVARGIADRDRLCVAGWSYGGMSTNYIIAQDTRFKCAISGASISNILAGYGTDEYVRDYEQELGVPWKNTQTWMKISFPFLHADRIRTPVLFMGGDKDFNVPLPNVEQMYQAVKSMGLESELIVYPGQFHELTQPSLIRDRLSRDIAWIDRHLKGKK